MMLGFSLEKLLFSYQAILMSSARTFWPRLTKIS
jgi:hypothetical protein